MKTQKPTDLLYISTNFRCNILALILICIIYNIKRAHTFFTQNKL